MFKKINDGLERFFALVLVFLYIAPMWKKLIFKLKRRGN